MAQEDGGDLAEVLEKPLEQELGRQAAPVGDDAVFELGPSVSEGDRRKPKKALWEDWYDPAPAGPFDAEFAGAGGAAPAGDQPFWGFQDADPAGAGPREGAWSLEGDWAGPGPSGRSERDWAGAGGDPSAGSRRGPGPQGTKSPTKAQLPQRGRPRKDASSEGGPRGDPAGFDGGDWQGKGWYSPPGETRASLFDDADGDELFAFEDDGEPFAFGDEVAWDLGHPAVPAGPGDSAGGAGRGSRAPRRSRKTGSAEPA